LTPRFSSGRLRFPVIGEDGGSRSVGLLIDKYGPTRGCTLALAFQSLMPEANREQTNSQ
jgi:hypothetical protein